jgi:hypothetical protein
LEADFGDGGRLLRSVRLVVVGAGAEKGSDEEGGG